MKVDRRRRRWTEANRRERQPWTEVDRHERRGVQMEGNG